MLENTLPLVSIVCESYNHEKYLRDCLDGFVMQKTNFNYEILIHDDASTDHSQEIIKEYCEKYPNLFYPIFQKENQYSKGIKIWSSIQFPRARGKYIAICEGDDFWIDSNKLQKQVDYMEEHNDCELCFTDFNIFDDDTGQLTESVFSNNRIIRPTSFEDHLNNRSYIGPMTWLIRRDIIKIIGDYGKHTDGTFALALDFFARNNVDYLPVTTAIYRVHSGSACHQEDVSKSFKYKKGVYDTQYQYACKYLSQEKADYLKLNAYMVLLPLAIEIDDKEYLQEAQKYFESKNVDYKAFYGLCLERYSLLKSKSLALGNALLEPVRQLQSFVTFIKK